MELAALALTAATLVAKSFVDAAAADTGKGMWSGAKRLYKVVTDKLAPSPAGGTVVAEVKTNPRDPAAIEALAAQIESEARDDDRFREALEHLVADADRHEPLAAIINEFHGDVRIGKQVNIGDVHGSVSI